MSIPAATFPCHRFAGSHHDIGEQFGLACADHIREHRDRVFSRLRTHAGIERDAALALALTFRPIVQAHAPFFDAEIAGLAAGSGLSLAEIYALQLRAELAVIGAPPPATSSETGDECTTFAVLPEATADGVGFAGQNADLPAFYRDVSVVVELIPDDGPRILMLTPAGQVSYIGLNDQGLCCFANYLTCGGWQVGFPRYMLSRLALTERTVPAALATLRGVPRASSRNLILLDDQGTAVDLETTPTRAEPIAPVDGLLAHSNHYLTDALRDEEQSPTRHRANSCQRYGRMTALLRAHRGSLTADQMETICRDRANFPDCISRDVTDDPTTDVMTFASLIAEPARRQLRVAVGPPHEHAFTRYQFSAATTDLVGPRPAGRAQEDQVMQEDPDHGN